MERPRLNLFALPSQTAILFYLLLAVLWGAIGINLSGVQIIPMWPFGVLLLLLPVYGFLLRPDIEQQKYNLQPPTEEEYPHLTARIAEAAQQIGLSHPPVVWIDRQRPQPVYSLGTFRRAYIVFSQAQAQSLDNLLAAPATAPQADVQILHELYHFRNGDIWQLGLLVEIFRYSLLGMGWAMLFLLGWGLILILAKEMFLQFSLAEILSHLPVEMRALLPALSPQKWQVMQEKMSNIDLGLVLQFVLNITIPYMVLATVLWLFYRPLLWRVREYYADAGVFQSQKDTTPFLKFVLHNRKKPLHTPEPERRNFGATRWFVAGWQRIRKFFKGDFWPDFGLRWRALQSPQTIFYDWKQIVWILGGLVLALEIFLASPLTLLVYGANPLTFSTLMVLAGLAYFLLPKIVLSDYAWRDGLKILAGIALLRFAWLIFTLVLLWGMYLLAPNMLLQIMQSVIYTTARYAGTGETLALDLYTFLLSASWRNLLQIPVLFVLQVFGLAVLLFAFRRILTWYGFLTTSQRFQRVVLAIIAGICVVLGSLVLPVSMSVLLAQTPPFFSISVGVVIALLLVGIFYAMDRRYHARCPVCETSVKSGNALEAVCESCGNLLLPWLVNDER